MGAFGDAGCVITSDPNIANKVRKLRIHGACAKYDHDDLGINSRLDALQAMILNVKIKHLSEWIESRQRHAESYDIELKNVEGIEIPSRHHSSTHAYHQYTIRILNGERDAVQKILNEKGVSTTVYYPKSLHLMRLLQKLGYRKGDFPHSEKACEEVLSLPMFPELTQENLTYVTTQLKEILHAPSSV